MLKVILGDPEAAHVNAYVDVKPEEVVVELTSENLALNFAGVGALDIMATVELHWAADDPLDGMPFGRTGARTLTMDVEALKRDGIKWLEITEGGAIKGHTTPPEVLSLKAEIEQRDKNLRKRTYVVKRSKRKR